MKYLICSDIHGSLGRLEKVLEYYDANHCDYLVILGDILYHGPRNPLPEGFNPDGVKNALNERKDKIIACRGNCDAEVDQMVLQFPVLGTYTLIVDEGVKLFCTHGHVYEPDFAGNKDSVNCLKSAPLNEGDIFLSGHTHIQVLKKNDKGILICNPGSISMPKNGSPAGFALYENRKVTLLDINGTVLQEMTV